MTMLENRGVIYQSNQKGLISKKTLEVLEKSYKGYNTNALVSVIFVMKCFRKVPGTLLGLFL